MKLDILRLRLLICCLAKKFVDENGLDIPIEQEGMELEGKQENNA